MKRLMLLTAAGATLAACSTVPPPPPPPPEAAASSVVFHSQDFAWSSQSGSGQIAGQVAYSRGGQRYACAGQPVVLIPDAPYSRGRIASLYGSPDHAILSVAEVRARQAGRPRDEYSAFVRSSTCDAKDHFSFKGLPAGGWFAIVVTRPASGDGEPVALMHHVQVRSGAVRALDLP